MSQTIDVNGQSINYPETGDTNWGDEATDFAVQTSAALGKLGLASGTSVDIAQTLDVTGNTTLDANLSVGGNASVTGNTTLTGNITVNGNSNLGNGTSDTTAITGILNVDSGVLYVDPTNNRVGINDATPSVELDVNGAVAITGNETVGGTLGITGDVSVNTNKFNITASSGNTSIAGTLGVTGNTTLTGTLLNSNGSSSLPSISFSSDPDNGFYYIGSNNFGLSIGGSKVSDVSSIGLINGTAGTEFRNVLQTVYQEFTSTTSRVSSVFGAFTIPLSINITNKSASSRIIVMAAISNGAEAASYQNLFRLLRGATPIGGINGFDTNVIASSRATSQSIMVTTNFIYSDLHGQAANTTITYNIYARAVGNTTVFLNRDASSSYQSPSSIYLMEVI